MTDWARSVRRSNPDRDLAVGYVTSRLVSRAAGALHMSEVSDAILAACG